MLTIPDNLGATGAILVSAISTISGRQIPGKLIDHCSKYRQKRMRMQENTFWLHFQNSGPRSQHSKCQLSLWPDCNIWCFERLSVQLKQSSTCSFWIICVWLQQWRRHSHLSSQLSRLPFQTPFIQKLSMAGLGIQVNLPKIWLSNLTTFLKNQICQVILVQACLGSHDRWTAGPPNSQNF